MSVEKLSECSRTLLQKNPFTQLCNEVILHIKDNDALRVYAYLQSKSQEWKVIKTDVKNQCLVGFRKMDQIFSYLKRAGLIRYVNNVDKMGKFVRVDIQVMNGLEFNKNEPFVKVEDKTAELSTENVSTPALSAAAVYGTCGFAQLPNKENTNERVILNSSVSPEIKKPKAPYKKKWEPQISPLADVSTQSTSFQPIPDNRNPEGEGYAAFRKSVRSLVNKYDENAQVKT